MAVIFCKALASAHKGVQMAPLLHETKYFLAINYNVYRSRKTKGWAKATESSRILKTSCSIRFSRFGMILYRAIYPPGPSFHQWDFACPWFGDAFGLDGKSNLQQGNAKQINFLARAGSTKIVATLIQGQ